MYLVGRPFCKVIPILGLYFKLAKILGYINGRTRNGAHIVNIQTRWAVFLYQTLSCTAFSESYN